MKQQELLRAMKKLDQQYQMGEFSEEEYQAAKILLSSQLATQPPLSKQNRPSSFTNLGIQHQSQGIVTPPLTMSQHSLVMPPASRSVSHSSSLPSTRQERKEQERLSGLVDALKDLSHLRQVGVLSEDEFQETKQSILQKMKEHNEALHLKE